jgi:hypothetical protein
MDWLKEHFVAAVGLSTSVVLLVFWRRLATIAQFFWNANKTFVSTERALTDAATRREAEAQRRCTELEAENDRLDRNLKDQTRQVLIRDEINCEDRAYIRALTSRLREKGIDYADINTQFKRND